jgi:predicted pyridoxine 5'-phosphate oxidase superfamily flavin-nucleotide-binding protein
MTTVTRLEDLRALYGPARERSVKKELPQLDAHAVRFIGLAPLVVLASRGADGAHGRLAARRRPRLS